MKKRIYSLLVSLFLMGTATVQVFGENARFFPANSIRCTNVITVNFAEMDETIPKETIYYEMWTGNDTIVDGKSCVTLWYQYDRDITTITDQPHKAFTPELEGVIYEADNGYVYFKYLNDGSNDWEFLYDFSSPNRKEGETICLGTNDEGETVYETIDQIRTCTLHNGSEVQVVKGLMYGIGYQNYPFFYPNCMWRMLNAYTPIYDPVNFYRNGELLWGTPYDMHSKLVANEQDLDVDGKKWHVRTQVPYIDDRYTNDVFMWVEGDTVVEDIRYKKLYKQTRNVMDSSMGTIEVGYCRQEGNKYYQNGELMFDFGLQEGDEFYPQKGEPLTVKRVGNIMLDDDILRKYLMVVADAQAPDTVYNADYWVEGIGSLKMGILTNDFQSYGLVKELQSCSYNGKYIYNKGDESEPSRPTVRRGYGIYYGDTYLCRYTINEAEEVTDSTDFARWNDKTVVYFDVDSIGPKAFASACFRQGQILYFTEKLRYIGQDAFSNIMMLDDESETKNPFGDLCIVFSGENPPSIEENCIVDYADTTYHITYVVPDLATYIASDMQWTYSQLVTIDDFICGYISPENEVTVNDSTEMDVEIDEDNTTMDGNVDLVVHTRPRKEIPVRIGEGENKDIYSRAPAWMRYTVELKITDTDGTVLYAGEMQCSAYGECQFNVSFACPANNIIHIYSRSIDMFGRATEWSKERINLKEHEYEGDYVTDANVDLNNTADADGLTATIGTDSIRITGYYSSNCGGGLYCVANARGNNIELIFHDGATANCIDYHHVDFMIPRFSDEIIRIDVIEPYPLEVTIKNVSTITNINNVATDAPYYDLMGRRVTNPTRGIYIRNGEKVVM